MRMSNQMSYRQLSTTKSFTSANQALRKLFDLYVNVRPSKSSHALAANHADFIGNRFPNLDIVVIRENTEDLYTGEEHIYDGGERIEAIKRVTKRACDRIAQYAFDYCVANQRVKCTAVHKANVNKLADGLYLDCHRKVFVDSPQNANNQIEYSEQLVDSFLYKLVVDHLQFDVIVANNLYGDLISDLLGGMVGSLGLMPAAHYNPSEGLALFEPTHGSAPDIAGQNIVNPISQWKSAAMMLQYLGCPQHSQRIENGIEFLLSRALVTPDLFYSNESAAESRPLSTTEMTAEMCRYLQREE